MNHSGDAAEQIVRMSLEGVEVGARISGSAAKEIALLLMAALKSNEKNLKLKGKTRLASMIKSGKALEIFSVKESDLKQFARSAKTYGIVYCVLRDKKNSPDGLCDVMVKAEDAPKISRVIQRLALATVDKAKIQSEITEAKEEKSTEADDGKDTQVDDEQLIDDFLGDEAQTPEAKKMQSEKTESIQPETKGKSKDMEGKAVDGPFGESGQTPPSTNQSKRTSMNRKKFADRISKPSVKEELRAIAKSQKTKRAATQQKSKHPEAEKPGKQAAESRQDLSRSKKLKSKKRSR